MENCSTTIGTGKLRSFGDESVAHTHTHTSMCCVCPLVIASENVACFYEEQISESLCARGYLNG